MKLTTTEPSMAGPPATTLGGRMRAVRLARSMTQDQVAQPEFTKSYVSAVERDKARPSVKALRLMATRLGTTAVALLVEPEEGAEGGPIPVWCWSGNWSKLPSPAISAGRGRPWGSWPPRRPT